MPTIAYFANYTRDIDTDLGRQIEDERVALFAHHKRAANRLFREGRWEQGFRTLDEVEVVACMPDEYDRVRRLRAGWRRREVKAIVEAMVA